MSGQKGFAAWSRASAMRGVLIALAMGLAWLAAVLILQSLGDHVRNERALAVMLLIVFCASSKFSFWGVVAPLTAFATLYSPVGRDYGVPSYQYVVSLLATDAGEASEFLSLFSLKTWLLTLLLPVTVALFWKVFKKSGFDPCRVKPLIIATVILMIVVAKPTKFIDHVKEAVKYARADQALVAAGTSENLWGGVKRLQNQYKNYVLLIGESARRDYFHLYGYPVANTPFLDSVKGTVVEGLVAGDVYTVGSLRLMLTKARVQTREPDYARTVVGLAKAGGFATYWFSNQGLTGRHDSPVAAIALQSEKTIFTKTGDYTIGNVSDRRLLKPLRQALADGEARPRFIVLHTMGSHPHACERVADWTKKTKTSERYQDVACYSDSIAKTDKLLSDVFEMLKAQQARTGEGFSILYFSDHGLSHYEKNGNVALGNGNGGTSRYQCDIPLVRINSDDEIHRQVKSRKTGLLFTDGLGRWLGLSAKELQPYDLFDGAGDAEDYGFAAWMESKSPKDDPAVDIQPYVK